MVIDPAMDKWVWISAAVFLALLGARAWVVETGQRQLGGTPARVRVLTVGAGVMLSLIVVLFMAQAGALLVQSLLTGTDPIALLGGADGQPVPGGQAPADPGAPAGQAPPAPEGAVPPPAPAGG
ncbi:MAG TPA: hypothetical protein VEZ42_01330 [Pseudonocardia sp.]|nr:hypothetical protein [Pseudonocardia sp.]